MQRQINFEIETQTWRRLSSIPQPLRIAAHTGAYDVNLLGVLLSIAVFTRPPARRGFDLSDFWAWMRYLPAFSTEPLLRLNSEWSTLDFHHKTVASGDFGVGFSTWILWKTLGFWDYIDVLHVVNVLAPNRFALGGNAKRGPRKSPDYVALGPKLELNILECKGTQSSKGYLRRAVNSGLHQKRNLHAIGGPGFSTSLVSGMFVPQWESDSRATFLVSDPEINDAKSLLFEYSLDQIRHASSRASMARDLAHFNLPVSVATLMGSKTATGTIGEAIGSDLYQQQLEEGRLMVERVHTYPEPIALDSATATGIVFKAELPEETIDWLRRMGPPEELGERLWEFRADAKLSVREEDRSVIYLSPNGVRFEVTLLG